jgi:2Fe-2S ferredoxin
VFVDPDHAAPLAPFGPDENDLLDSSDHRTERSRLSCQLRCEPGLEGARFEIAPKD